MSGDQRSRPLTRLGTATALLLGGVAGSGALAADAGAAVTPTAVYNDGTPSVGALFGPGSTRHTCTASVIDSPAGDLLITAAHCIRGRGKGYVYVPEYHDGDEPFGAWTVTEAFAGSPWTQRESRYDDVAFLAVAPQTRDGRTVDIQAVTGGQALGYAPANATAVTVPAYAAGSDDQPFSCRSSVYYDGNFPAFDCHSYPDGTSGSPWLVTTSSGVTVAGVIGGLHQGGCDVVTSYTTEFGGQVWSIYEQAVRNQDPAIFPAPGSAYC